MQTYDVTKVVTKDDKGRRGPTTLVANDLLTPPPNVGARTTPAYNDANGKAVSGATSFAALDRYTRQTVFGLASGEAVFAGPREDGFFADTPGIFDLLDPRILARRGSVRPEPASTASRASTCSPTRSRSRSISCRAFAYQSPFFGPQTGVGVYASVSRPSVTIRLAERGAAQQRARSCRSTAWATRCSTRCWSRSSDKDNYNRRTPTDDAAFATYARNPELADLINTVFGTNFATTNRDDLVAIFIPDVLRVNTGDRPGAAGRPGRASAGSASSAATRPAASPAAGRTAGASATTSSTSR